MINSQTLTIDNLEENYLSSTDLSHRKEFAQFFTPEVLAELMASWLLGKKNLHTILEPAFGLGIFSRKLLEKKPDIEIQGFEIDSKILETASVYFEGLQNVKISQEDFMLSDWHTSYDGIICNPPYFKFHDYDNKLILGEVARNLNIKFHGATNLYTLFLIKSIYQLSEGGRCAFIVPSEFLNSNYGIAVKRFLLETKTLRNISVFDFKENVFDDALTTACIILCAKDHVDTSVKFIYTNSVKDLSLIEKYIDSYPANIDNDGVTNSLAVNPEIKWKTYYMPRNHHYLQNLVPFSNYAKVVRGIATGSNEFFTFSDAKAANHSIGLEFLLPCITSAKDVTGPFFTVENFQQLVLKNRKIFLLNIQEITNDNIVKYLEKGEQEQIHKKYLTSKRNPWYSLEKRPPAPIWVSVFNRTGLKFILNEANISNLTTFHCVYPKDNLKQNIDLLFAYLLTKTSKMIFSDNSRQYGNGLQKFEPNDLNKAMMLDINKLSERGRAKILDLLLIYRRDVHLDTSDLLINRIEEVFISELC